jgi:two-component system response regulator FixJ
MVHQDDKDTPQTVYVIDDNGDLRRSMHFLLDTMNIRARLFARAEHFLESVALLTEAPILLDLRMPEMDGLELMLELDRRGLDWPVIVMTAHGDVPVAVRAMKLGAIEFLEKPFESEALEAALRLAFTAVAGHAHVNALRAAAAERLGHLTPRETEVVRGLAQGKPNKVIAHELALSPRTVEMHRSNAMEKLNLKSLAELITLLEHAAPGE